MHLTALHRLRGLAALYVVLVHVRTLLWAWPSESAAGSWPDQAVGYLLGFPHQAVLLFFVISGFCIHQRQAVSGARRVHIGRFAARRIKRLWPPLALALALTAMFDAVGGLLDPSLYAPLDLAHSVATFVGNLLMQSQLAFPVFGTNVPLWSLGLEAWLYVLYPVFLVVIGRVSPRRTLVFAAALSVVSHWLEQSVAWWPLDILNVWGVWVAGALLAEVYARGALTALWGRYGRAGLLASVTLGVVSISPPARDRIPDAAWGLVLTVGLMCVLMWRPRAASVTAWLATPLDCLGDISYSLYLSHFPFVILLAAIWRTGVGPIPLAPWFALGGIAASIALASLAWWAVERHCLPVRPPAARTSAAATAQMRATRQKNQAAAAA